MALADLAAAPRRSYRSRQREGQARLTRERILAAASEQFQRHGYAATRIRAVAQAAGVSVPTVELLFGTKGQLLRAAISFSIRGDAHSVPMLERPWAVRARAAGSADEFLSIVGRVLVGGEQRSAGLIVAALEAAGQDDSLSPLADQLRGQRAETAGWLVDQLTTHVPLRAGLTRAQGIDTVWLLMDPHGFVALTRDRGWTSRRFEAWFIDSVRRLLLNPEPVPPRAGQTRPTPSTRKRRAQR